MLLQSILLSGLFLTLLSLCAPQKSGTSEVIWTPPTPIENLGFFTSSGKTSPDGIIREYTDTQYARVGSMSGGVYDGDAIIRVVTTPWSAPYLTDAVFHFVKHERHYLYLSGITLDPEKTPPGVSDISGSVLGAPTELACFFDHTFDIPTTLSFSGGTAHLIRRDAFDFSPKNLVPVMTPDPHWNGKVFVEASGALWSEDVNSPERAFQSDGLYMKLPDGTTAVYMMDIPFVPQSDKKIPQVTWMDDRKNADPYFWYEGGFMCGAQRGSFGTVVRGYILLESMHPEDILASDTPGAVMINIEIPYSSSDLTPIGRTLSGGVIQGFKNRNHPVLRNFYKKYYLEHFSEIPSEEEMNGSEVVEKKRQPLTYEAFVRKKPLFLWRDPLGREILFVRSDMYYQSACGAKPVIYLYPEISQDISVQIDTSRKAFVSIPEYGSGWQVHADPDGTLRDTKSGKIYPYLFWEDILSYRTPESGWSIERGDVPSFLREKLTYMGLSEKEQTDFLDFWLPFFQEAPYYTIRFLQNDMLDRIAPLSISPKPDSMIRVFMEFSPTETMDRSILPQRLIRGDRSGYHVVEWGGRFGE